MAAPPGASPANHHAAAVRRRPCGRARSPRSRPRGSNTPVPLRSGRQSPSLTRRAPNAGRRRRGRPPTPGCRTRPRPQDALAFDDDVVVATAVRPSGEGSASWWRRAPVRPETREPGSSRTPAGVVVGNRPLPGARWRDRRSAPQRGFCSRKRTNVCGRRGVGLFARASLSILSSAAPLSVVRALSRADSGRRGGTEGRGRGFSCAGRHGEGQRLQGLRLLAASSGAGPDGPKPIQPPPSHRRKVSHGSVQAARYPGPGRHSRPMQASPRDLERRARSSGPLPRGRLR